jgi:hypothetical protein
MATSTPTKEQLQAATDLLFECDKNIVAEIETAIKVFEDSVAATLAKCPDNPPAMTPAQQFATRMRSIFSQNSAYELQNLKTQYGLNPPLTMPTP